MVLLISFKCLRSIHEEDYSGSFFVGIYKAVEGIYTPSVVLLVCTGPGLGVILSYGDYQIAPTLCPHTSPKFPSRRRKSFCDMEME